MRGQYIKGKVEESLAFPTLASGAATTDVWDETASDKTRISSIVVIWAVDEMDVDTSVLFGVMHSDYTSAELEEFIENSASWNQGDLIAQEINNRKIRLIGHLAGDVTGDVAFNDGKPVKTKLNWTINTGQTLKMWVYNRQAAAVAAAGHTLKADGHANLWMARG